MIKILAKKFYIHTYGCQMNVADSEMVSGLLTNSGYEKTSNIDQADILLFNSCTVRQHAEERVLGRIKQECGRKSTKPNLVIGLLGCVAQRAGNKIIKNIPLLDFTVGTDNYRKLPLIIEDCIQKKSKKISIVQDNNENYENIIPLRNNSVNAFVTIMRGCNNYCTYCIVPYVRGRERSREYQEIIKEVENAGNNGFKDVTLLGQNVNSYNDGNLNFPGLIHKVSRIDSIQRIRFVTSHPKDLSDDLIKEMAQEEKICEHLHLPLQSGSDSILKKMNRNYTISKYKKIIAKLKNKIPDIAITTDIMVGFPGETEEDFDNTYRVMKEIRFDYAFTFKYSPRKETKAAKYKDQIPEKIRLQRLKKLIDLQQDITSMKYKEKIGKIVKVYVEKVSKKNDNELSGRTRDNKIVVFPGRKNLIGEFIYIKVTNTSGLTLRGKIRKE